MSPRPVAFPVPPGRLPLLGDVLSLRQQPLEFLESLRELGPLVELRIGPQRAYLPTTPELTEQVLITQARHLHKGVQFEKLRPLIGNGLASSNDGFHRRQRNLVRSAFHPSRFDGYLTAIRDVTTAHIDSWQDGRTLQLDHEMYKLSASIATRILYHNPIDADTAATIDEAGLTVVRGLGKRVLAPFGVLERLPTPDNRRYRAASARLHEIVDHIIAIRRNSDADHGDLLFMLLHSTDPDSGEAMTDQQVHDEVMSMLGGATESTAVTLAWTLHEIARHPATEHNLLQELDKVASDRDVTLDDLGKLDYLKRVINETLRLQGPAWVLTRRATTELELGGHRLPVGSSIWYSPYLIHHDPQIYPDPARFDPDRWLTLDQHNTQRCTFIPFGAGLRVCIAEHLARAELMIVLTTLLRRWQLHSSPGRAVRRVCGFVLGPSQMPMIPTRRN